MATKAEELESGCLSKAALEEPIFVLRAQDILAPDVVRVWVQRAQELKTVSPAKIQEALDLADKMEAWKPRREPT